MPANNRITGGTDGEHPVAVAVLSVKKRDARCRLLANGQTVTLRLQRRWDAVPGEIALVAQHKLWRLAGTLVSARIEASALGLTPLRIEKAGMWDPDQHYWGDARRADRALGQTYY